MKKIMLFLTIFIFVFCGSILNVHAQTQQFYEAEYIDNIYLVRKDGDNSFYQKARFFRRMADGKAVYCLDPFTTFDPNNNSYEERTSSLYFSDDIQNRITLIAGFGYGYPGHEDPKWYAITQLMIWQEIEPQHEFYFTEGLNGPKTNIYDAEMSEIYQLINHYQQEPSFSDQTFYGVKGQEIVVKDENGVLPYYTFTQTIPGYKLELNGNQLSYRIDAEGDFVYTLIREGTRPVDPVYFYDSPTNQNLMTMGSVPDKLVYIHFHTDQLSLQIQKIDQDTGGTLGLGEAKLNDAVFTLYDQKMNPITEITLDANAKATITSDDVPGLSFGTYYLKETKTPTGYQQNDQVYQIAFSKDNTHVSLTIPNERIKKELIIKKEYGNDQEMKAEANVSFEIYDGKLKYIDTITTDENGIAKITLPYGSYTIHQITTTEGYTKVEPFYVFIESMDKEYFYHIYDYEENTYEVEVPNTYSSESPSLLSILFPLSFVGVFYVKKITHYPSY